MDKVDVVKFIINQAKTPIRKTYGIDGIIDIFRKEESKISCPFVISDLSRCEFLYASKNLKYLTGYSCQDVKRDKIIISPETIHHDDFDKVFIMFEDLFNACFSIPASDRASYKFSNTYRMRKANGEFIWLLHEFSFLKFDVEGKPLIALSQAKDITSIKENDMLNLWVGKYDETGNYSIELSKKYLTRPALQNISKRELEILKLISNGFSSKQIAERLHISLHTVNTHRQNMLQKANASSSGELVGLATKWGII